MTAFNSEEPAEEDDEKGTEKENGSVAEAVVEKTQDFGGYVNGITFDDASVAKAYENLRIPL